MPKSWRERIEAAIDIGSFTSHDELDSESRDSCAIGEQGDAVVFGEHGPTDYALFSLGREFQRAVTRGEPLAALDALTEIELRVAANLAKKEKG